MTVERSPGDHGRCATHRRYQLTCDQYEGLITECGNRCQICRFPASEMPYRRLYIDHDFRGTWAVRGLLCIRCNSSLGDPRINAKPGGAGEYLANAWFLRMLQTRGASDDPTHEPPHDAVIENQFGVLWTRNSNGIWTANSTYNGHTPRPRPWPDLFRDFGPHNLRIVPSEDLTSRPARTSAKRMYANVRVDDVNSCARTLRRRMPLDARQALARLLLEE